ncbi:MAG: DEAD/DEAH box helicase [Ectobacillus sp.]
MKEAQSFSLAAFLEGKRLLRQEIPFSDDVLKQHESALQYEEGIVIGSNGKRCRRCGNEEADLFADFPCAKCGKSCMYCRNCIMMGRVSECVSLISWRGEAKRKAYGGEILCWSGTLSEGQQEASNMVVQTVEQKDSCLVWAVCGAGKTEVLFAGIQKALQQGERVCIATPRTDVVLELHPRLQQVFPSIPAAALYGGSSDRYNQAPLVISTTHQLLRYFRAFDTIIIDEADAFPYAADEALQYAVQQARKEVSSLIYLTATPNGRWQREAKAGKRKAVVIPARYHRHPLPIPSFIWCGNWRRLLKKRLLPKPVMRWIQAHLGNRPIFIFVPYIAAIEPVVSILKELDGRIEGVHAEDRDRKEKVAAFRKGDIPLLATTTILERGVTVPNLQVGVIGAEEAIFTESALVQIAGRAGRNAAFPNGDVVYFHYGKTEAMLAAKQHIEKMNRWARQKGWIV